MASTITLNDINKHIKSVKNIEIKLNINNDFEQSNTIPKRVGNYVKVEKENDGNIKKKQTYNVGDIIEIPEEITKIWNWENFYIYGVSHKNSLIESIFYHMDSNFKFENDTSKLKIVNEFKELLKNSLNEKKNLLSKKIDNNEFDNEYIDLCAKYFNINILCIDVDDNKFHISRDLSEDKDSIDKIIIVKMFSKYLPVLHMFGEKPNYSTCSVISSYFKQ